MMDVPEGDGERRVPDAAGTAPRSDDWQRLLLPWMTRFLVGAGAVFAIATMIQLWGMQSAVTGIDDDASRRELRRAIEAHGPAYLLELSALERRYQQTNSALLTRTWIKYLGFLTGMTMMFVGGVYILGRLQEEVTTAHVDSGGFKATFGTASPGVFVTACGTAIIMLTIYVNHEVNTRDGALYVARTVVMASTPAGQAQSASASRPTGVLRPEYLTYLDGVAYPRRCSDPIALDSVARVRADMEVATAEELDLLHEFDSECANGGTQ